MAVPAATLVNIVYLPLRVYVALAENLPAGERPAVKAIKSACLMDLAVRLLLPSMGNAAPRLESAVQLAAEFSSNACQDSAARQVVLSMEGSVAERISTMITDSAAISECLSVAPPDAVQVLVQTESVQRIRVDARLLGGPEMCVIRMLTVPFTKIITRAVQRAVAFTIKIYLSFVWCLDI